MQKEGQEWGKCGYGIHLIGHAGINEKDEKGWTRLLEVEGRGELDRQLVIKLGM